MSPPSIVLRRVIETFSAAVCRRGRKGGLVSALELSGVEWSGVDGRVIVLLKAMEGVLWVGFGVDVGV